MTDSQQQPEETPAPYQQPTPPSSEQYVRPYTPQQQASQPDNGYAQQQVPPAYQPPAGAPGYQQPYPPQQQTAPAYGYPQQPVPQYGAYPNTNPQDTGSIGWGVLGFFFPLVGFILWLVWKQERPLTAKKAGVGALIGVIAVVALYVLIFVFAFTLAAIGSAAN